MEKHCEKDNEDLGDEMTIKLIVNGYFRSGTTLLWDITRKLLKDHVCFYEPLHHELAQLINSEKLLNEKNKLHQIYLFKEYSKIDDFTLRRLLFNHPNYSKFGILNERVLFDYLNIYNDMNFNVALQPNRLSLYLDIVLKKYKPKSIHIIRHPLDVYTSIKKAYYTKDNKFEYLLKVILRPFLGKESADINKTYKWSLDHLGKPVNFNKSKLSYYINYFDIFGEFVVVWTLSNYYAIKAIEENNGLLLIYENLIKNSERELANISKYLGVKKNKIDIEFIKDNSYKFDSKMKKLFEKKIKKYKLEGEFNYIKYKVEEYGIEYL